LADEHNLVSADIHTATLRILRLLLASILSTSTEDLLFRNTFIRSDSIDSNLPSMELV